jgi:hypothetical protein
MARVVPALLAGTIVRLLAGCSGGSSGSASPGSSSPASSPPSATATSTAPTAAGLAFSRRYGEASAMLVQCGLSHGTIKPQTGQPWYSDGKILPLSGSGSDNHNAEFSSWWDANGTITIGGMTLSGWREWAATNAKLPPAVCGPSVSASALQARLFPGEPNSWDG